MLDVQLVPIFLDFMVRGDLFGVAAFFFDSKRILQGIDTCCRLLQIFLVWLCIDGRYRIRVFVVFKPRAFLCLRLLSVLVELI